MPVSQFFGNSLQGLTHSENQDGYLILDKRKYILFAVFDGVSCSQNPRKGVEGAIEFIRAEHSNFVGNNAMRLKEMMYGANQYILKRDWPESLTTYVVAGFFKHDPLLLYFSNLGDSRIYFIRNSEMHCLTKDDTLWPGSNVLTRCLGIKELPIAQFREKQVRLEDGYLLLASDGFYSIMEMEKTKFIQYLDDRESRSINMDITTIIAGKNIDDATYVIVKNSLQIA